MRRKSAMLMFGFAVAVAAIDGEAEFWQWQDELNAVDGLGNPVPIPDNARLYLNSGFSHINVAGLLSPAQDPGICQNLRQSGAGASTALRALTIALD
jgi:hypothetical protein